MKQRPVHMRVDFSGQDGSVPEHLLHRAEIGSSLEQMCGERVSEDVGIDILCNAHLVCIVFDDLPDTDACERSTTLVQKDPVPGRRPATLFAPSGTTPLDVSADAFMRIRTRGALCAAFLITFTTTTAAFGSAPFQQRSRPLQIQLQYLLPRFPHGDQALLVPFPDDADKSNLRIVAVELEIGEFRYTHSSRVEKLQNRCIPYPRLAVPVRGFNDSLNLFRVENVRQLTRFFRELHKLCRIGGSQVLYDGKFMKASDAGDVACHRAGGQTEIGQYTKIVLDVVEGDTIQTLQFLVDPDEQKVASEIGYVGGDCMISQSFLQTDKLQISLQFSFEG